MLNRLSFFKPKGPKLCHYIKHYFCTIHIFRELRYKIKLALNSGSRDDPEVRIEVPFDPLIFADDLQQVGKFTRNYKGHSVYTMET